MNSSVKGYHRKPTYDELIQEAVINPTETIKYPNRIATQLRNTAQLTRFDDESYLEMSTINSNAIKQNMQQTAVQRALQTPRPIPSGLEHFDTTDTDENLRRQMEENEELLEEGRRVKKRREDYLHGNLETAEPDQIGEMIGLGSSAASGSGYTRDTVRARTQAFEEQTSTNLRGSVGRRSTDSTASGPSSSSAGASSSAAAAASSALSVAIPPHPQSSINIDILVQVSKERIRELNQKNTVDDSQLAMETDTLIRIIEKLRSNQKYKTKAGGLAYVKAKKRLIEIMDMPL